jgi:hypothetical protein
MKLNTERYKSNVGLYQKDVRVNRGTDSRPTVVYTNRHRGGRETQVKVAAISSDRNYRMAKQADGYEVSIVDFVGNSVAGQVSRLIEREFPKESAARGFMYKWMENNPDGVNPGWQG